MISKLLRAGLVCVVLAQCARAGQPQLPRPDHIVVVIEENKSYQRVVGYAGAPYFNSLLNAGANFTESYGITHPSQPNYVALFSGSLHGVADNSCIPPLNAPCLASELIAKGFTFGCYSEDLPAVGSQACANGHYQRKHNPAALFSTCPDSANMPFTSFPSDYSQLPTVSFVVPNQLNDMHDGSVEQGDAWLQQNIDAYAQWCMSNNSLLIVTFDEDDFVANNHIPTFFYGPMVAPGSYSQRIDHYTLLRMLEEMYGLAYLGESANADSIINCWTPGLSETTVASSPNPSYPDEFVQLTASVQGINGGRAGTGTVTFIRDGVEIGEAALENGSATLLISPMPIGDHFFGARYNGDEHLIESNSEAHWHIVWASTTTQLSASRNPVLPDQEITFTATVTAGSGVADGVVTFKDGQAVLGSNSLVNGVAALTTIIPLSGDHSITAEFVGSTYFAPSSSGILIETVLQPNNVTQLTSSANPSNPAQAVVFTIVVQPNEAGAAEPTGTVALKEGGTLLAARELTNGRADVVIATLGVGDHPLTAHYFGDEKYTESTSPPLIHRVKYSPGLSLVSSANPSYRGQPVTFNATITTTGFPTGLIRLFDEAAEIASAQLNNGREIVFVVPLSQVGTRTVRALYDGDAAHSPAASGELFQNVLPTMPPSITSPLTAAAEKFKPFLYRITADGTAPLQFSAANLPTGLSISGDTISGAPLASGATLIAITAANYGGSETKFVKLAIATPGALNSPPRFVSPISATPNPAAAGQPVTFNAHAADDNDTLLEFAWDFGDGAQASEAVPVHAYAAEGIYNVSVEVSDGTVVSRQAVPIAVGPASGDPAAISKTQLKFDLVKPNRDTLTLSGTLPIASASIISFNAFTVAAGANRIEAQAAVVTRPKTLAIKSGPNGTSKFTLTVKNQSLFGGLEALGFTAISPRRAMILPLAIHAGGSYFNVSIPVRYKSNGKAGTVQR